MRKFYLAVPFFLFSTVVTAETVTATDSDADNHHKPLTIVISAARVEQSIENVGSSVTVLSVDELQKRGIKFVADALAEVPSVVVSSQGARGSKTQIRIRGNEANHVLVLIDGVRVSDATTGEYDIANLSLDAFERIEVLLGPQSTLYGSDAIAGVISITTRKGGNGFGGHIQAAVGSLSTQSDFTQVYGGENGWHYAVTASHYETDGISVAAEKNGNTETDAYETKSAHIKAGFDHSSYKTWIVFSQSNSLFNYDFYDDNAGLSVDDNENYQRAAEKLLSWTLTLPAFNNRLQNQLQLSNTQYDSKNRSLTEDFQNNIYYYAEYFSNTDRDSLSYQGSYKVNNTQSMQFGFDKFTETLASTPPDFTANAAQSGLYMQWLATVRQTDLLIGTRSDKHDEFGRHNTVRTTASYHLSNNWRIRGAYGTGFKAPSLSDLYNPAWGANPDLKPEESSSIEVGMEYQHEGYKASITAFDQNTENLIRFLSHPTVSQLENVDDAASKGVEISANADWRDYDLTVALTKLDATESKDGITSDRLRIPAWSADVIGNYVFHKGRAWAKGQYRGTRRDFIYKYPDPSEYVNLKAYWLFDVGTSYELDKNVSLSARIENLTDEDYEEVYSYGTRGRTVTATVDWRF